MNIPRTAYQELLNWSKSTDRKPLLLRGARQVGKTTLVRSFAKEFDNFIELNLERESDKNLFEIDDVKQIFNAACLLKKVDPSKGSVLLFIDEIQESPDAIKSLRFFYEDIPNLFVVAAGSLLEFALSKVASFPVGRVEYLYLHPISFEEYLLGLNHSAAVEALNTVPIPNYANKIIIDLFHEYAIIGGMPAIVKDYLEHKNIAQLSTKYKQLWQAYRDDIEKYKKNETNRSVIRHLIKTAPIEQDRIKFEGFGKSTYRSREVGEALRALDLAKIIRLIYPTTNLKPPIMSDLKKRPRLQLLDTGLLNNSIGMQGEMIGVDDLNEVYKGRIIQHLVYQELISRQLKHDDMPHFWVREKKDSNSELDLVIPYGKYLIPVEIKSGKTGRLRSLHQFVDECNHNFAVRIYAGSFKIEKSVTPKGKSYVLMNLPYFLSSKLDLYLKFFIEK